MVPPSILETDAETKIIPETSSPMSEDEFVAWAMTEEVRAEWVNGEIILMSPAAVKHVRIIAWLDRVLGLYVATRQLGELFGPELMVRLIHAGVSRRVPDLLFVSTSSLQNLKKNHLEGAPDLIIEVVSPDSVARDWREKFIEYEASGVREYWIIDPIAETLEASVRSSDGKFVRSIVDANGFLHAATIPGFYVKPDWFWRETLPDMLECLRQLGVGL